MGVAEREPAGLRIGVTGRARLAGIGLALIAGLVLWITLKPTTVDAGFDAEIRWLLAALHEIGVPAWFRYRQLEFTANAVMFVPLGFFTGMLLGRRWPWGLAAMPLASACIEAAQFCFLPGRYATVSDIVANSLGGWVGGGLAALIGARFWGAGRPGRGLGRV